MAIKRIIIAGLCFLFISTCTGISSAEDEDGYVVRDKHRLDLKIIVGLTGRPTAKYFITKIKGGMSCAESYF